MTRTGKIALHALEENIVHGFAGIREVFGKLKEIRDDKLYQEAGFQDWNRYCRETLDMSAKAVDRLIFEAETLQFLKGISTGGT